MTTKGLTGDAAERNRERVRAWRADPANRAREAERKRLEREADPERWRAIRKRASDNYLADPANRRRQYDRQAARRREYKQRVIDAYGGRCACPGCHVHHVELLTVDHVGGNGGEHRRVIGRGREIYKAIIDAGFPPDYQVLCGSCNLAKANNPACPVAGQEH